MTKMMMSLILAGAALAAVPATAADRQSPEAQLAEALQGRTAGTPVDCVNLPQVRSTRIIPGTAILYDTGSTIYVNRPRSGGDQLNQWDTMVTRLNTPRLCSIDTVRMVDPSSHMMTGIVFLGDFVPYRRDAAN
jgi:hypothetical protein